MDADARCNQMLLRGAIKLTMIKRNLELPFVQCGVIGWAT